MGSKRKHRTEPASQRSQPVPASFPASSRGNRWILVAGLALVALLLGWLISYLQRGSHNPVERVVVTPPSPGAQIHAAFAGSQSCKECHQKEFEKWASSNHGLAERPMDPAKDDRAFVPGQTFKHGTQTSEVRKTAEGKYEVIADGPGNQRKPFEAVRAIGVQPLVQYLTPFPGGRFQTLEASWGTEKGDWFNVYGDEDRKPGEWGHWAGRGMNWNSMCAVCHNTRLLKNYDLASDSYKTTMVEMGVGCESCHGPMKDHVEWQKREGTEGRSSEFQVPSSESIAAGQRPADASNSPLATRNSELGTSPSGLSTQDSALSSQSAIGNRQSAIKKDPTIKKVSRKQMFEVCGSCHSRRGELTGDFAPRDNFFDHHWLTIPDATDVFYPDGQIREEDYEFTSFLSSRMYAGGVRCMDCHDSHAGKPALQGNALCMKCHSGSFPNAPVIDPAAHSFHKPESTGSLCVNCHMPQTLYMQKHWRHDHGFTIPDPLLTKEHGIPNACNKCHDHQKESTDWAIAAVDKWYGAKMDRPSRQRARTVALARQFRPEAREGLLKILKEERITMWRATAANLLAEYADAPEVRAALLGATKHTDPLVRENAVRALEILQPREGDGVYEVLRDLLSDASRGVRVRAAWVLRNAINLESAPGKELLAYIQHNADQPAGLVQLGLLRMTNRDAAGAVELFRKAVEWDPNTAVFRDALSQGLAQLGEGARESSPERSRAYFRQALEAAQAAARIDPRNPEYRYKLALGHAELGEMDQVIEQLQETIRLAPGRARAWYNLGLAFSQKGQLSPAAESLRQAEKLSPRDPEIPYALATVLLRQDDKKGAAEAAMRALQINPGYTPAQQLLGRLGRR